MDDDLESCESTLVRTCTPYYVRLAQRHDAGVDGYDDDDDDDCESGGGKIDGNWIET